YTAAEIDRIKADSASMGQGRAEKVAKQEKETLTQELQSTKTRLDALEARANEARLAEARGDPVKLRTYQGEQAVATRERQVEEQIRDIARREGQLKADREEVNRDKGVVSIAYVAAKHGLEVEDLESLGISDPDALEKVAVKLAAAGKPPETEEEKTAREAREAAGEEKLDLDTGEGSGSGEKTEQEKLDERYPTMAKNK
ncbi:unnamed protein product, partial [marine sediment metagenome]